MGIAIHIIRQQDFFTYISHFFQVSIYKSLSFIISAGYHSLSLVMGI